jgi:ATP-binding cassette subfamily B (MDR/TAP) protein 1
MKISRDEQGGTLQLSQAEYIRKVLQRFNMRDAKPIRTPLASHFRLSKEQCPETDEEKDFMARVPYASTIGSLMYAMVCTKPDISHAVGVVSRYMSNPGKQHWEAVKWILRYLRGTTEKCLTFKKKSSSWKVMWIQILLERWIIGGAPQDMCSHLGVQLLVGFLSYRR